jgi:hypothetical protein
MAAKATVVKSLNAYMRVFGGQSEEGENSITCLLYKKPSIVPVEQ